VDQPWTEAHCRRVAALACEIARRLQVPLDPVCDAALAHHLSGPCLTGNGLDRLLNDLRNLNVAIVSAPHPSPSDARVESIIEVAHAFEQGLEFSPYEPRSASEILEEIAALGFDPAAVQALRSIAVSAPPVPPKLAAYPSVLFKALALLRKDNTTFSDIESLVRSDQVMASSLLSVANAALYAPLTPIKSIGRAVAHIGVETAKKVLVAAAARPLFASSRLRGLWQHSTEVATVAERLARAKGVADPAEAFVAGLIHDIGRLATESLGRETVEAHHRIADDAQCVVVADMAVLGCDHGAFGARVIGNWGVPSDLVSTVEFHHRPELTDSVMSKLIYLAEFISESDEDIPSVVRLKIGMNALRMATMSELFEQNSNDRRVASLLALAG
jgi:putative nucleotidyltransferase with HDIG domain